MRDTFDLTPPQRTPIIRGTTAGRATPGGVDQSLGVVGQVLTPFEDGAEQSLSLGWVPFEDGAEQSQNGWTLPFEGGAEQSWGGWANPPFE